MAKKSFDQCIESIIADIELRKNVDYGKRKSVSQYNKAYDRIAAVTKYIDENYSDQIDRFISLIHHDDPAVSFMFCCLILNNRVHCMGAKKQEALQAVKALLSEKKIPAFSTIALPMIIQEWENEIDTEDQY